MFKQVVKYGTYPHAEMQISPRELVTSTFQDTCLEWQVPDRDLGSHDPFRVGGSSPIEMMLL
jgi:hypothetical protein